MGSVSGKTPKENEKEASFLLWDVGKENLESYHPKVGYGLVSTTRKILIAVGLAVVAGWILLAIGQHSNPDSQMYPTIAFGLLLFTLLHGLCMIVLDRVHEEGRASLTEEKP